MIDLRKQLTLREKINTWFDSRLFVVYTMGKVGTLTICNSLSQCGFNHVHPHSLYYSWPGIYFLRVDLSVYEKVYHVYRSLLKNIKVFFWQRIVAEIKIITGVRDPFSRSVSAYFEQIHYNGGIPQTWSFDDIKNDFLKRTDFFAFDRWIESELIKFSGIDVLAVEFDRNEGCCRYESGKKSLFIYRLDKLNQMNGPLSDFCGQNLVIESTNFGSTNSGDRYVEFLRQFKFDRELAERMAEMRSFKHFYSEEEIQSLLERWT